MSNALLEKLRSDQLQARKNKDVIASNLLTTLLGEIMTIGKNAGNREPEDTEIIQTVKKFLKSNAEAKDSLVKAGRNSAELDQEKKILEIYLPTQLSEGQLKGIIQNYIDELSEKSMKQMGTVMGKLKSKYDGEYDGKMASSIVKSLLV
jgi:uncharacterized protein